MTKKWVVVFEYDLEKGLCFIAKKDAGNDLPPENRSSFKVRILV